MRPFASPETIIRLDMQFLTLILVSDRLRNRLSRSAIP